jgi:hypothetical protein
MKTVRIPNGFLHLNESLANCPECGETRTNWGD